VILHAPGGDKNGNVLFFPHRQLPEDLDLTASRTTRNLIVTVEQIVAHERVKQLPYLNLIPRFRTTAIVEAPYGAHPFSCLHVYDQDREHLAAYARAGREAESFHRYLDEYVYGVASHDAYLDLIGAATFFIVAIFVTAMAVVLWNAGLMGSLRRYGEIGVRLAIGESKHAVYRSLLAEAFLIGLVGSAIGTAVGLGFSFYMQEVGVNISGMISNATMVMDDVLRARITPASYIIGFVPGLLATFLGAAISGLGVYKRDTAMLAKELGS
jgi:putative ABC transport system permease protein